MSGLEILSIYPFLYAWSELLTVGKKKKRVKDITKGTICVNTPEQKELRSEHILLNVKLW